MNHFLKRITCTVILLASTAVVRADQPIVLNRNGGWCWFQSERAIVVDGKVVFTSIAGDDHGDWSPGDLVVTSFQLESGAIEHQVLHAQLNRDDHAVAGLCLLADQRVLAVYGSHGRDALQRFRMTTRPGEVGEWSAEQTVDVGANYCYSNVYRLPAEKNRIFNFHRGKGFNPNCNFSDDGGQSWLYGWRLAKSTRADLGDDPRYTGTDGTRPYVNYTSNHKDEVHFIMTNDHPRAYDNSLYHGFYRNGKLHDSDGTNLATPGAENASPLRPQDYTEVFAGDADHVAWGCDIELDSKGHPYVAFSVQVDGSATRTQRKKGGMDHRFYYGRWDGERWHVDEMAFAGTRLYAGEDDYTGLVALDPNDPNTVVISTNADPQTGKPLISSVDGKRHWKLYQGTSLDRAESWSWKALTLDSDEDQLRPVIPNWPGGPRVILWSQGKLTSYQDYDLDILGLVQERNK